MPESKVKKVLKYFKNGHRLTDESAYRLCGTHRFSSIIFQLRHDYQLNIQDRWLKNENTGTRYKEYWLVQ